MTVVIKLFDCQNDRISYMKVTVGVASGVKAQTYSLIRESAEYAASIFSRDYGLAPAPDRMALHCAEERIFHRFLDRDPQLASLPVIFFQDTL